MPKYSDTKPWERLEGESVKAYEAFTTYLNLGAARSQKAVSEELSKSRQLIGRWSATYKWVERTAAYDADIQQKAHADAVKKARKMSERHISIALKLQEKALAALAETDPKDIDPKNLLAFLREATKLERENRVDIVEATDTTKAEDNQDSSLADVIADAWERRRQKSEYSDS